MLLIYKENNGITQQALKNVSLRKIAILADVFPRYSQTSIYREFLELQRAGVLVAPFSLRHEVPGPIPNEAMPLLELTSNIRKQSFLFKLRAHFRFGMRSPLRYFGALVSQLMEYLPRPHRLPAALRLFHNGVVLSRLLQLQQINHLHVHFLGDATSAALVARRLTGLPYSVAIYATDMRRSLPQVRSKLRKAEFVIANSNSLRDHFCAKYSFMEEGKVTVIRPGVDTQFFMPCRKERNLLQKPRIITIGELSERSGIDILLKACKILDKNKVQYEAIIIGEGPAKNELQAMANALRLNHRVRFTGARRMEEIIELMSRADIFVLPCRQLGDRGVDSYPLPMLEAMAAGLPVITTDLDGLQDLVEPINGKRLPEENYKALAEAIEALLKDSNLREKLGNAGRKKVQKQFNLQVNVQKLARSFGIESQELDLFSL